jgi:hypothetical protein
MVENSQTEECIELVFIELHMLHSQHFINDVTLDEMVKEHKLGIVDGRGVETYEFFRFLGEHSEKIIAVVAADISYDLVFEIEMGFKKIVFDLALPL